MPRRTVAITALVLGMLVSLFATRSLADRDNGDPGISDGQHIPPVPPGRGGPIPRRFSVFVVEATYGGTTVPIFVESCPVIEPGNVTAAVDAVCEGQQCAFTVDTAVIGDPAFGCWKSFEVTYHCGDPTDTRTISIPADPDGADNQTVLLACPTSRGGRIRLPGQD